MQAGDVLELNPREERLKRMRRSLLTSARLLRDEVRPGSFRTKWAMVTLTYAPEHEWEPCHIVQFIKAIREYLRRRGHALRYVWVAELQKRGALHYHVLLQLPKGITLPKPDKRGWWPHGMTKIEWARHALGYLAKYASKGTTDDRFPKGARISGAGGLSQEAKRIKRWWLSPSYVREAFGEQANPFRASGGGWLDRLSGEWLRPLWGLVAVGRDSIRLVRLAALPPALPAPTT